MSSHVANSTDPPTASKPSRGLTSDARIARFTQVRDFLLPRLGRHPTLKAPQARNSAWAQLVQLATTEQQLKEVTEMMPGWIASGRTFDPSFSHLFARESPHTLLPACRLYSKTFKGVAKNFAVRHWPSMYLAHTPNTDYPLPFLLHASLSIHYICTIPSRLL